jgi:hypothetical protein
MRDNWLISNLGNCDKIQTLHEAVLATGRQSQILTLGDFHSLADKSLGWEGTFTPTAVLAPVSICQLMSEKCPNFIGNSYKKSHRFDCRWYYMDIKDILTQRSFCFENLGNVLRHSDYLYTKYGSLGKMFIKPCKTDKSFHGGLVHQNSFKDWAGSMSVQACSSDTWCVVARPEHIQKEYRFIIAGGKIITGSLYRNNGVHEEREIQPVEILHKFAPILYKAVGLLGLPSYLCYTIDVAENTHNYYNQLSILEIGPFSCAGLYACNLQSVAEQVSLTVEDHYASGVFYDE